MDAQAVVQYISKLEFLPLVAYVSNGDVYFEYNGLQCKLDIPPETDGTLALDIWPDYAKKPSLSHSFIYNERHDPHFLDNAAKYLNEPQFIILCQLLDEIYDAFLKQK